MLEFSLYKKFGIEKKPDITEQEFEEMIERMNKRDEEIIKNWGSWNSIKEENHSPLWGD